MKNSLVNRVKEGAKQIGKKVILPLAFVAGSYMATSQDVSGQSKNNQKNVYSYENHNKGATIEKDKIRVKDGKDLEVKMLQGKGEYFQNLPLTSENFPKNPKKISNEDIAKTFGDTLGLISFYKNTAQYDLDAYTKGFLEVSSKEPYQWVKAKDAEGNYLNVIPLSLKINPKTGKPEIYAEILCDEQMLKRDGITDKNASYIAKENLEEILKQLTNNLSTLNLNRRINEQTIRTNYYFPAASDSTVYLIPNIEGNTKFRILPATKNKNGTLSRIRQVAIVSPLGVYEKTKTNGEVIINSVPTSSVSGTAVDAYAEPIQVGEPQDSTKTKTPKEMALYGILGANANNKFIEGQLGIQYGPVALVGNYGKGKDERVKEITTPASPSTGRYGYGIEDNLDVKLIGLAAELHPLHNKKVSPFIAGGINKWDYTTEISEEIRDANNNVVKQNKNSATNSEISYKGSAGLNFNLKNSKVGLQAGYDNKAKFFAGARYSLKLGR